MKKCFKCNTEKPLTDYYKHSGMADGHLGKCKDCTKSDTKERHNKLLSDPSYVISEQKRHREKYYKLGYKDKHKPNAKNKKKYMDSYKNKYPEKIKARSRTSRLESKLGNLHHWSYNDDHLTDVIDITIKEHAKAHRFLIYDQERMMYRRIDTNELLDTKEKHLEYINWCIKNKED